MAAKRINKELTSLEKDLPQNCMAGLITDDDLHHWQATLQAPEGCFYEDGIFQLDINLPKEYPFKPPKITFLTKIYHPAVNEKGEICLGILTNQWSPALTVAKSLFAISTLLSKPGDDDYMDVNIYDQLKKNPALFEETARQWTRMYAMLED